MPPGIRCSVWEQARSEGSLRASGTGGGVTLSEQDAAPEQADSLGQLFRITRIAQGMTIGQMSAITRLQEDALRAMEEERFDRLPPRVFAKGSVRSYARALKLDEEHCVQLFSECSMAFYKQHKERPLVFPRIQIEDLHKGKARRSIVFILVSVLLLVLLRVLIPSSSTPSNPTTDQQTLAPRDHAGAVSKPTGGTNTRADASETAARGASRSSSSESVARARSTPVLVTGSEDAPFVLELRASAEVWAEVRSDDGDPREVLLRKGERAQWRAHDRFLLTLGNAGAVETTLNGRRQGPFGDFGVVVRDIELRP